MATDGVLGASWLPTDGYLDPVAAHLRAGRRRAPRRLQRLTPHAGDRDRRGARARRAACSTDRGDIECEVVVNAGGMYAAEIGRAGRRARADRADGARVPGHAAVPGARRSPADAARPRPPHLLPRGGRRAGDGRLRARSRRRGRSTGAARRIPPDFNGRLLEEDWDRFEEIVGAARMRVPAMEDVRGDEADQRAGGVHARRRVLPRRDRGARVLRRRRASARTGWPARAASAG